ncbi:hypothetical protein PGT21_002527 [Puccinia graminis f. sp. tritici]|uniref:Major facilitator superfamily (MFS) profile domain-containing protein n=1 Tax=Puccinia graminis f. sp. tritici TaxID=56615 RepID=A0A5B0REP0_PUCGR|nr:hypothetical protein PGT21_002527 [Puccinia graminis f. sp. tritici]KAA1123375.1 hypothetical protein PGTUg99_017320 [Puccinia graminis f. sp. tritici]
MEFQGDTNPQTATEASRYLKEYYCHTQPQASTLSQEKRALLKLDLLLIPILGLFFFLSFLDRSNLGNVRIIGLQKDLDMSDYDFTMALTVTFM